MSPTVVDVDDLICEGQIREHLVPLHEAVPHLILTAYTIPNWMGPVTELRQEFPWIRFGIHGFEHTFCECLAWTDDLAKVYIEKALEMGYDPIFKPPNWRCDEELEKACETLGVVLHHHREYQPKLGRVFPGPPELRKPHNYVHTHIIHSPNPVVDFIADNADFTPSNLADHETFATPNELACQI